VPVKKWLITAGAVVLAAAVAVTVWVVTRVDEAPDYFSPERAVLATCDADPLRPPSPLGDALYPAAFIQEQGLAMTWQQPGDINGHIAVVQSTPSHRFQVTTCDATLEEPPS
jgi:hypothetical protein